MVWPLATLRSYASVSFIRWSGNWLKTAGLMGYIDPFVKLDVACKNRVWSWRLNECHLGLR